VIDNPVLNEVTSFADSLYSVTEACNAYVANQVPQNSQEAVAKAKQLTEQFAASAEEHIVEIVSEINAALSKDRSADINAEASIVEDIRKSTDIIEASNLVLTYKAKSN